MEATNALVALSLIALAAATQLRWNQEGNWGSGLRNQPRSSEDSDWHRRHFNNHPSEMSSKQHEKPEPHRELLKKLYTQILGTKFASPGLEHLAFVPKPVPSDRPDYETNNGYSYDVPSIPFHSQPPQRGAHYELPQYVQPPPPSRR